MILSVNENLGLRSVIPTKSVLQGPANHFSQGITGALHVNSRLINCLCQLQVLSKVQILCIFY